MKYDVKIMLPFYRLIYPILFLLLLSFVRGISDTKEIGIILDSMLPVLAIVFMSDTYQSEYRESRWEVMQLYDVKKKRIMICRRILIQIMYLFSVSGIGYWLFYIQNPAKQTVYIELSLFLTFLFACIVTIAFFGMIALSVTNIFNNMWIGMGGTLTFWLLLNSTTGNKLFQNFNVLAYSFRDFGEANDYHWMIGKVIALLCVIVTVIILPKTIKNKGR